MIKVQDEGALRIVTLARPEKANALTEPMLEAIIEAAEGAQAAGMKALILTGEGKVFCAGADLAAAAQGLAASPIWARAAQALADFEGLSVVAANGALVGGGFALSLACDLRIAVQGAKFFYPVMRLGYLPPKDDPARLAALIGPARAKMLLMGGARIEAEEALVWGLIERICAPEALLSTARALCADALAQSRAHVAALKSVLR